MYFLAAASNENYSRCILFPSLPILFLFYLKLRTKCADFGNGYFFPTEIRRRQSLDGTGPTTYRPVGRFTTWIPRMARFTRTTLHTSRCAFDKLSSAGGHKTPHLIYIFSFYYACLWNIFNFWLGFEAKNENYFSFYWKRKVILIRKNFNTKNFT